jgi:plasmid stability protein
MKRTRNTTPAKPANIGISGLSEEMLTALRELAKRNHRSLAGEVRSILEEHVRGAK